MEKYKVLKPIEFNNKFLLEGDELLLISEFNGGVSTHRCTVASKTLCSVLTREKIVISLYDFNKIEKYVKEIIWFFVLQLQTRLGDIS